MRGNSRPGERMKGLKGCNRARCVLYSGEQEIRSKSSASFWGHWLKGEGGSMGIGAA
jgi:hypothetical protein